ncbi:MAG: hypothetical protein ACK5PF_01570, partial [bacterium]
MAITVVDHDFGSVAASTSSIATGTGLSVQVGDILVVCTQHSTAGDTTVSFSGGNVSSWNSIGSGLAHS